MSDSPIQIFNSHLILFSISPDFQFNAIDQFQDGYLFSLNYRLGLVLHSHINKLNERFVLSFI